MLKRLLAGAALLALGACSQYGGGYGQSYGYAPPSAYNRAPYDAPAYGGTTYGSTTPYPSGGLAADRAAQGCASGAPADVLHQNRPGGSDYNPARCRGEGY